jgi:hypothetical protein
MNTTVRRAHLFGALALMCVPALRADAQKGVMLMNRIGPSAATLYVANRHAARSGDPDFLRCGPAAWLDGRSTMRTCPIGISLTVSS